MQLDNNIDTEESNKIEDIADIESNSYKESEVLSLDTSDIDLDEMVKNKKYVTYMYIYTFLNIYLIYSIFISGC